MTDTNTPPESKRDALWQPIDTAPKDGTWILLRGGDIHYHDECAEPPMVVGKWDDGEECWRYCSYDSGFYGVYRNPQEWMPLPK